MVNSLGGTCGSSGGSYRYLTQLVFAAGDAERQMLCIKELLGDLSVVVCGFTLKHPSCSSGGGKRVHPGANFGTVAVVLGSTPTGDHQTALCSFYSLHSWMLLLLFHMEFTTGWIYLGLILMHGVMGHPSLSFCAAASVLLVGGGICGFTGL